uniref:RBR-type E3 ubiquitin transferase n=1 Tax=Henneguya salminicola TaxID=69463 RepID=A0A6B2FV51_HENSL
MFHFTEKNHQSNTNFKAKKNNGFLNNTRFGDFINRCKNVMNDTYPKNGVNIKNSELLKTLSNEEKIEKIIQLECPICLIQQNETIFYTMKQCKHSACINCLVNYLFNILLENAHKNFECPCCTETIHPEDILNIIKIIKKNKSEINLIEPHKIYLNDIDKLFKLYEDENLKATLNKIQGLVWCPGPDCKYAVICDIKSKCPEVECQSKKCGVKFCANCKTEWHKNMTCKKNMRTMRKMFDKINAKDLYEKIKNCPGCAAPVSRNNDGSCNHMKCIVCNTNFCWLCMKLANDFHFLTPSGCTYYSKRRWSSKTTLIVQCLIMLLTPFVLPIFGAMLFIIALLLFPHSSFLKVDINKIL